VPKSGAWTCEDALKLAEAEKLVAERKAMEKELAKALKQAIEDPSEAHHRGGPSLNKQN